VLRRALQEPDPVPVPHGPGERATSQLTEVECLRTLDRLYRLGRLSADEVAAARAVVFDALDAAEVMAVAPGILRRASEPLPTPLGTLDAIHLVSALTLAERFSIDITFATHDRDLGRCARACGLDVIGV
jgi:hypothetical protein